MVKNVIIGVLLIAVAFFKIQGCNTQKDLDKMTGQYQLKDSAYLAAAQEAKRWKTEAGLNVLRVNNLAVSKQALEQYNQELKKELKAAKVKISTIQRQTEVATVTTGEVRPKTDTIYSVRVDSSGARRDSVITFEYRDKWLDLDGKIKPEFLVKYQMRDSIRLVWHYARDGLLKPKKLRLTAYSLNPNATISGIKDFEIKTREKRFFIGIGAGYGYNGGKFVPTLGLIGGYKILRL